MAIRVLITVGQAAATTVALVIAYWFPINVDNHKAILDGIERHKRGEDSIDPLTARVIPPPASRADEASGWFLDNFSSRELERFLTRGPQQLAADVWRVTGFSLAVCLITGFIAWWRMQSNSDPGALASLAVVVSGSALALFVFHLLRIKPARGLAAGALPNMRVRVHLDECRSGRI